MIPFQIGDQVRVIGLPTSEWNGAAGVVVKTVERDAGDHENGAIQECVVQFPAERRWFLSSHLVRTTPDKTVRFFRGRVLDRWGDLSIDAVAVLKGNRDELIALLQEQYGFNLRRAKAEVDDFWPEVQERIPSPTEVSLDHTTTADASSGARLTIPAA
jgi:hypothetical protein